MRDGCGRDGGGRDGGGRGRTRRGSRLRGESRGRFRAGVVGRGRGGRFCLRRPGRRLVDHEELGRADDDLVLEVDLGLLVLAELLPVEEGALGRPEILDVEARGLDDEIGVFVGNVTVAKLDLGRAAGADLVRPRPQVEEIAFALAAQDLQPRHATPPRPRAGQSDERPTPGSVPTSERLLQSLRARWVIPQRACELDELDERDSRLDPDLGSCRRLATPRTA